MKFLFEHYNTFLINSTEQFYLSQLINEQEDQEVFLRNPSIPLYKYMDVYGPDVYVTHVRKVDKELLQYMKEEKAKIKLFISLTEAKMGHAQKIVSAFEEEKIEARYFGNFDENKVMTLSQTHRGFNFTRLRPCCDVAIKPRTYWKKKIDLLIVSNDRYEADLAVNSGAIDLKNKSYHCASTKTYLDIDLLPLEAKLYQYHNYKEIIFTNIDSVRTQYFLDAIDGGNKVYYLDLNEEGIKLELKELYGIEDNLDYSDDNKLQDLAALKDYIAEKHSSRRRVKTLLSQLPQKVSS